MSPGVRVGVLIGPPDIMPKLHKWSEDTYIHPALVTEGIVYEYCRRGLLAPNIEKLKALYHPRMDCMLQMEENRARLKKVDKNEQEGRVVEVVDYCRACELACPAGHWEERPSTRYSPRA